jgi:pyocin large subunit-like protein
MKDTKPRPETPPLSRAERKVADKALAAAKFTPTADGGAIRTYAVHGIAVTERVSVADALSVSEPPEKPVAPIVTAAPKQAWPPTQPLSMAQRKVADAAFAASQFVPSSDGKNAMRRFVAHGMAVTEFISNEKAADTTKK